MIDKTALKRAARQSIRGKKPSAFIVAAVYIAVLSVLTVLIYALSGFDRFAEYLMQIMPVNPYLSLDTLLSAVPVIRPEAVILILLIVVVRFSIDVGFMSYCLKISRDEKAELKSLFDSFAFFFKVIWLEIIQIVLILLWSLLFVIPGIIAYYSYRQAFYILLDNPQMSALDCIRASKRMMGGYKMELFTLDLSFIGWFFVDYAVEVMATLRLFSIWLSPYIGVTRAGFYNLLKSEETAGNGPQ